MDRLTSMPCPGLQPGIFVAAAGFPKTTAMLGRLQVLKAEPLGHGWRGLKAEGNHGNNLKEGLEEFCAYRV